MAATTTSAAMSLRGDLGVPGTERLIDVNHDLDVSHAGTDIILIPQPTSCSGDPLLWSRWKKYYQLFLVSLYACSFSFGENNLGAAWTTISKDTDVSITDLNGGGALNYLLLGFVNIFWVPMAMKLGRRFVFLATTLICIGSAIWTAKFHGTGQWMASNVLGGLGTSAYEAVIQLSVFDMFFAHERGRMLAVYIFGQQLGSILGLITGGYMADSLGWRWSQYIVAIVNAGILVLLFLTFEETLFPRFLFSESLPVCITGHIPEANEAERSPSEEKKDGAIVNATPSTSFDFPRRMWTQRLQLWVYYPQDRTTYWQYFRRPFFLLAFPNIVIAGFIFAFGCTAGIVSFNTISEILTSAPYNWSAGSTGLVFLAALVGSIVGWATGLLSDQIVIWLARRNGGIKEPEMRLWTLIISFVYAAVGYMLYGWGAEKGLHWMTIAFGIGCMIAHQVSATSIATAYAMECFQGVSGELVVVLAMCSSCINFAISYSVQPFIDRVGYGWVFVFFGFCVLASMIAAIPLVVYGKSWRKQCTGKYQRFLKEREGAA